MIILLFFKNHRANNLLFQVIIDYHYEIIGFVKNNQLVEVLEIFEKNG